MTEDERKFRFIKRCVERRCKSRDASPPAVFLRCKPVPRAYRKAGGTAIAEHNRGIEP